MDIHIRNMVCDRCIRSVQAVFEKAGISPDELRLGVAVIKKPLTQEQVQVVKAGLISEGFEWLDDQKVKLVEQIKQLILALVQKAELDEMKENLSSYLSSQLHKEYHYLSALFSSQENTSIEQYFILQKIEKVKEWLVYNEFTLGEIAFKLGYSSVAHLSGQFKKVTGFTPSQFKQLKVHQRHPLDKLGK